MTYVGDAALIFNLFCLFLPFLVFHLIRNLCARVAVRVVCAAAMRNFIVTPRSRHVKLYQSSLAYFIKIF